MVDYKQMTAPYGRDCFNCPVHLSKDNEKLKRIVSKKLGLPLEDTHCKGCRDENGLIPFLHLKKPCQLLACSQDKGVDFCCDCEEFPCERLQPLADMAGRFAHNLKVYNLCLIKKLGLETWAETKAQDVFNKYFRGSLKNLIE